MKWSCDKSYNTRREKKHKDIRMIGNEMLTQFTDFRLSETQIKPPQSRQAWFQTLLDSIDKAVEALRDPDDSAKLSIDDLFTLIGQHRPMAEALFKAGTVINITMEQLKIIGKVHSDIALKLLTQTSIDETDQRVLGDYFAKIHPTLKQYKSKPSTAILWQRHDTQEVVKPNDASKGLHILATESLCDKLSRHQLARLGGNDPVVADVILKREDLKKRLKPNCAPRTQAERAALIHDNTVYIFCEKYPSIAQRVLASDLNDCLPETLRIRLREKISMWEQLKAICLQAVSNDAQFKASALK